MTEGYISVTVSVIISDSVSVGESGWFSVQINDTPGVKIHGKSLVASRATNFKILVALLKI